MSSQLGVKLDMSTGKMEHEGVEVAVVCTHTWGAKEAFERAASFSLFITALGKLILARNHQLIG